MAMERSTIRQAQGAEGPTAGTVDAGASAQELPGTAAPAASTKGAEGGKRKRKHYTGRPKGADETRRLDEARAKLVTVRVRIREFATELVEDVYGEHGPEWGTRFRDIEILGDVIGAEVATRFTEGSVNNQARLLPKDAQDCPRCRGSGDRQKDDEPRSVHTLTGVVNWNEPEFHCVTCRRAFFPSKPCFGD
jgi:hypothetical protein